MPFKYSAELVGNAPRNKEKSPVFKAFINRGYWQLATADFYIFSLCHQKNGILTTA